MNSFFELDSYIIDQEILSFGCKYKVQDTHGKDLGLISENKSILRIVLGLFIHAKHLPFDLRIEDNNQNLIVSIRKNISGFTTSIAIFDANDTKIATIRKKITLLTPTFEIYDNNDVLVAFIKGDWSAWDFTISSPEGKILARIDKKFNSVLTELFTTADKYKISLKPWLTDERLRVIVIASAAIIDKIYKEGK